MNLQRLKQAEAAFMAQYPGGFKHPDMVEIGKRHKMDGMIQKAQENFAKRKFRDSPEIVEEMARLVGRSSMVSMFEKPKFRDFVKSLNGLERESLASGLRDRLHGNQQKGFDTILDVLQSRKLAKWSLISILPVYFNPDEEVFVKPTTAKGVITHFELEGLTYKPQPSWEFYVAYQQAILKMKSKVRKSLAPNNAAFTGFLMMAMREGM